MTETVDLYVIARLEPEAAVAEIYCCEVFYDLTDGSIAGRGVRGWWESVVTAPEAAVSLDALDDALTAGGYQRLGDWRPKVTASGLRRFFADATTAFEDLDR